MCSHLSMSRWAGHWSLISIRGCAMAGGYWRPRSKLSPAGSNAGDDILVTHKCSYVADASSLDSVLGTTSWWKICRVVGDTAGYHGS